jgi:hypothetical protein
MKTQKQDVIDSFSKVVLHGEPIELLINNIKNVRSESSIKYAFQAFCCAVLARQSNSMLQKGKYIQQYGEFINRAIRADHICFETRLIRFLVEKNLTNVQFESHQSIDRGFLNEQLAVIEDKGLIEITSKALSHE